MFMLGYLCSRPLNWIELIPDQTDESHSSHTLAMPSENPRWPRTCHKGQRRRREAINSIQHCLRVVASTCLPVCIFLLGVNYSSVFLFRLSPPPWDRGSWPHRNGRRQAHRRLSMTTAGVRKIRRTFVNRAGRKGWSCSSVNVQSV